MTPIEAALLAVVAINAITWAVFRLDKVRARRGAWRIPERTLLGLAAIGGWAGALVAMYGHRQRHKTSKRPFALALWAIVAVHIAVIATLALR